MKKSIQTVTFLVAMVFLSGQESALAQAILLTTVGLNLKGALVDLSSAPKVQECLPYEVVAVSQESITVQSGHGGEATDALVRATNTIQTPVHQPWHPPPLAWETRKHTERASWSKELRKLIREKIETLEEATGDAILDFAPNYTNLNKDQRIEVWASLLVAMARAESAFKANEIGDRTKRNPTIGLFQLGFSDRWGHHNKRIYDLELLGRNDEDRALTNPLVNIRCAVKIFAFLLKRDGLILSGHSREVGNGAACYWGCLWNNRKSYKTIRKEVRERAAALAG